MTQVSDVYTKIVIEISRLLIINVLMNQSREPKVKLQTERKENKNINHIKNRNKTRKIMKHEGKTMRKRTL